MMKVTRGWRNGLLTLFFVAAWARVNGAQIPELPPLPPEDFPSSGVPPRVVSTPPAPAFATTNRGSVRSSAAGVPYLRPPPSLARPPETRYVTPLSDLTQVPGLAPSSVYNPLPGRSSPVIRPALPLAPGVSRRSLDPTFSTYAASPRTQETVLTWDGLVKEVNLKPGELKANFAFAFTNSSSAEVVVNAVRTSCGCTTAKLPALPWKLPAGTNASFEVVMDVRGKSGIVTKTVTIETSAGYRYLTTRASVPASGVGGMATADRARNLQVALADRQAALKGDCAVCHVTPGVGKHGEELYVEVCGVCHEAEHRASMVPNLQALNKPFKPEDWQRIIHSGKKDSLMPAFAASEGGPLTEDQVQSLVTYLTGPFKTAPATVSKRTPVTTLPADFPQE